MKHLMARLLNLGLFATLSLACSMTACAATPTSGVNEAPVILEEEQEQVPIKDLFPVPKSPYKILTPKKVYQVGWTIEKVNVRKKPSIKAKVIGIYPFNKKIKYKKFNKKWIKVTYKKRTGYISKSFIKKKKVKSKTYNVPKNNGYKCGEYYTAITCKSSPQYKLQYQYAYTGNYGIRMVNGRYCVAIGSYFNCHIGQYFTLVLKNGTKIECIKGDEKADKDTDWRNIFSGNGCMSEFLITKSLTKKARLMGDISYCNKKWKSPVVKLIVYKKNVLKGGR